MKARTAGIAAALILCGAAAGLAQSWTITLGPGNTIASTNLQQGKVNIVTQGQATITVSCQSGVDCSQAGLRLTTGASSSDLGPPLQSATGRVYTLAKSAVSNGSQLSMLFANDVIGSFQVGPDTGTTTAPTTTTTTGTTAPSSTPTLAQLLALPCPGTYTVPNYDQKGNQGEVVVTPLGTVLVSNLDTLFDENDTLIVRVVADNRLLPLLDVERTSAFRDVTSVQILGAGETVPTLTRQSGLVADCGERRFLLENFAPGRGQVQISALQGTQLTPTGSFDFNVNPLYTGMLTLGAARTQVVDPGYKLASVGGQTVVAAGEEGDDDLVYALFYTPFLWGKRDVQKDIPWYEHINLTVGIAPEDITDNAFAGLTADLPGGIAVTFGWHFRKVEVLTQGISVGDPFSGTADQLPTAQEWEDDQFVAVSVDLRAMVQVLRAAAGGGGGS